jgi:hypothetical protein
MRRGDLDRLNRPYPAQGRPERRLGEALGVALPAVADLHDAISADLDERIYGIGWWAPHPGTSRRIIISDHLVQCVASIPRNLVEARLHLLEALDYWERESDFVANAGSLDQDGRLQLRLPPRVKPLDDLPHAMASLHVAGFFRAVIAALDCLGAVIVGVLALPIRILTADLRTARHELRRIDGGSGPGADLQATFCGTLDALAADVGPPGWLGWTMAFRHMLVHRARRLQFTQLRPRPLIFGPDGRPVIRIEALQHLSRDPRLSDIEALLRRGRNDLVLSERAETTLDAVLRSTERLVDGATGHLLEVWRRRRAAPALLAQPREQWPDVPSSPLSEFPGYASRSVHVDPGILIGGPDVPRRLMTAALTDDQRDEWQRFD